MRTKNLLATLGLLAAAGCSSSGGIYPQRPSAAATVSGPALAPARVSVTVTLTAEQTAAVRSYYSRSNPGSRGRGNGRGNGLPPGIAKNLARGKPLPPGIAMQTLPRDLVVTLPRLGNGLEYVVAAGKLLLVETATQVVRQVLIDALYS